MRLKRILPIEINYALKHFSEWFSCQRPDIDVDALNHPKRIFFLDAPAYGNIGDQAIAYAMESFMADVLNDYSQIEITEDQLPSSVIWLKKTIRDKDIICLTGGGNMGVMYQRYESVRRLVMKTFPNNTIIVFPQTFDYGKDRYGQKELDRAQKLYGSVKRLILCARDEDSYKSMSLYFPKAKVIFCPDIALYLDYRKSFKKTGGVGVCLRNDQERVLTNGQHEQIGKVISKMTTITTIDESELPINQRNRKRIVENKLREFGSKELIVTDRLHGMIFAFITDTPCLAFPNTNGKVERVSRYLSTRGNVQFTKDICYPHFERNDGNGTAKVAFGELMDAVRSLQMSD